MVLPSLLMVAFSVRCDIMRPTRWLALPWLALSSSPFIRISTEWASTTGGARHPPRLGREGKLELTEDHGWNNRA